MGRKSTVTTGASYPHTSCAINFVQGLVIRCSCACIVICSGPLSHGYVGYVLQL
jgi:hypothetical protein